MKLNKERREFNAACYAARQDAARLHTARLWALHLEAERASSNYRAARRGENEAREEARKEAHAARHRAACLRAARLMEEHTRKIADRAARREEKKTHQEAYRAARLEDDARNKADRAAHLNRLSDAKRAAMATALQAIKEKSLTMIDSDDFVNTTEASAIVRYAATTLNRLRCQGGGPPFYRLGRKILYSRADLMAFVRARRHSSTSEYEKKQENE